MCNMSTVTLLFQTRKRFAIRIIKSRDITHFKWKLVLTRTCYECIVVKYECKLCKFCHAQTDREFISLMMMWFLKHLFWSIKACNWCILRFFWDRKLFLKHFPTLIFKSLVLYYQSKSYITSWFLELHVLSDKTS